MARQRQTGSYTWTQVKSVQNLIERCLSQYMTQAEVDPGVPRFCGAFTP